MLKMSNKLIRNEFGGGMMAAMMAFAALGAGALMMGDVLIKNDEVLTQDSRVIAYRHMVDSIRKNIYANNNCTAALRGQSIVPTTQSIFSRTLGIGRDLSSLRLEVNLTDKMETIGAEWKARTGTSIKEMKLLRVPSPYDSGSTLNPLRMSVRPHAAATPGPYYADQYYLVIVPDHKGINVFKLRDSNDPNSGYMFEDLFVKLLVIYDPVTNQIDSCHNPASDAALCTQTLQGYFNFNSGLQSEMRCEPDAQCFNASEGIVDLGTSCQAPFQPVRVGATKQICSWCHPRPIIGNHPDVGRVTASTQQTFFFDGEEIDFEDEVECSVIERIRDNEHAELKYETTDYQYNYLADVFGAAITEASDEAKAAVRACLIQVPGPSCTTLRFEEGRCPPGELPYGGTTGGTTTGTTTGTTSGGTTRLECDHDGDGELSAEEMCYCRIVNGRREITENCSF